MFIFKQSAASVVRTSIEPVARALCRCITGNLAEFVLTPIYSHRSSIFACHVEPVPRYKIYDVEYAVLYKGAVVNERRLKAQRLYDSRSGHPDKAVDKSVIGLRY